ERRWDVHDWFADNRKARVRLGWQPRTDFRDGLRRTAAWYKALPDKPRYVQSSKKFGLDTVYSVSAVIACYKDNQAIPIMYGRRVKREAPLFMRFAYKAFYRVFDYFSFVRIPHDAGDFSLMDKRVVRALLQFPERDLFLRGVRAFAGFKQAGVDYVRPERMF